MDVSAIRRLALAVSVTGAALLGPALPVLAQSGNETAQVGTAAEAWYQPPPTCTSPLGCGPAPAAPAPSIYPPGTLHVGVTAGVEDSRTYLRLDLSGLTRGSVPVGGLVTLPIATGQSDGTRAPEAAKVRLCLVTAEVVDGVEGDTGTPPPIDCAAAQSPAALVPAADPAPPALTADLTPFAAAWAAGAPMQGLAVVPAEGVPPTDAWHVAFSQTDRMVEGAQPITASLTFSSGAGTEEGLGGFAFGDSSSSPTSPSSGSDFTVPSFGSSPGSDLSLGPAPVTSTPTFDAAQPPAPEVAAPTEQPPSQQVAAPAVFSVGGFAYPAVFLLPLLFAGAATWAGRALTRDLLPSTGPAAG